MIFKYATLPDRHQNPAFEFIGVANWQRPFNSNIAAVLMVCRKWYTIALDPALWVYVDNYNHMRLKTFTERSSPLSLTLFLASWSNVDIFTTLKECGSRAKRIHVTYCDHQFPVEAFFFPAPYLETFILYGSDRSAAVDSLHINEAVLFGGQAQALRAIAISPVVDWIPGNRLPNLTHLYLSFDCRPSYRLSDILLPLYNFPDLEVIQFAHATVGLDGSTTHDSDRIVLRRLKHIMFLRQSDFGSSIAILRRLELPPTVFIYFDAISVSRSNPDNGIVDSSLLPPWRGGDITQLEVGTEYSAMHLLFEGPSSGFFLRTSPHDHEPVLGEYWMQWLFALPKIFSLGLTTVRLARIRLDDSGNNIGRLLRAMSSVEELEIIFPIYDDIPAPTEGEDSLDYICRLLSRDDPVLCPQLHTLIVILERAGMDTKIVETSRHQRHAEHLKTMLAARAHMGRRVQCLRIQTRWRILEEEVHKTIYPLFRPLADHVDEYESYEPHDRLSGFRIRPEWWDRSEGVPERYWDLKEEDWPKYKLPWFV